MKTVLLNFPWDHAVRQPWAVALPDAVRKASSLWRLGSDHFYTLAHGQNLEQGRKRDLGVLTTPQ